MTDIEVFVGDGSLKEKPIQNKKKEELLVRGTSDEGMIQREFDEPNLQQSYEPIQQEPIQTLKQEEEISINKVEVPKDEKTRENTQLAIQKTYGQKQSSMQKYLPGMQFIEHVGVGGMCEVERVE